MKTLITEEKKAKITLISHKDKSNF